MKIGDIVQRIDRSGKPTRKFKYRIVDETMDGKRWFLEEVAGLKLRTVVNKEDVEPWTN
jgi:hypothetical protein